MANKYLDLNGASVLIGGIKDMIDKTTYNTTNMVSISQEDIELMFVEPPRVA